MRDFWQKYLIPCLHLPPSLPPPYLHRETVVGVSLGAPSEMIFTYAVDKRRMPAVPIPNKHVWLPRGSMYIMSGLSRFEWKHGVFRVGKKG